MGKQIHILSNIVRGQGTKNSWADCKNCGRVNVKYIGGKYPRCNEAVKLETMRKNWKKRYPNHSLEPTPKPKVCEVCEEPSSRPLQYDHSHATNKFRGWICYNCNLALGLVKDNPETLRKLANYLEK